MSTVSLGTVSQCSKYFTVSIVSPLTKCFTVSTISHCSRWFTLSTISPHWSHNDLPQPEIHRWVPLSYTLKECIMGPTFKRRKLVFLRSVLKSIYQATTPERLESHLASVIRIIENTHPLINISWSLVDSPTYFYSASP